MECPNCPDSALVTAQRQGVEIDCCPNCRGIWLDRGEIDSLIERAATAASGAHHGASTRAQPYFAHPDHLGSRGHRGARRVPRLGEIVD
jgi:Zn-finger nucleic acid-binding protein